MREGSILRNGMNARLAISALVYFKEPAQGEVARFVKPVWRLLVGSRRP